MATANAAGLYRPRRPERTVLYRVLAQHFERFVQVYDERFAPTHGPLTQGAQEAVYRYLDCGIFANGFARVRCGECGHDFLVAFSCKLRCICPSCHTKRELIWAEWAAEELLEDVPHRQVVCTIPKRLRPYFRYDRTLMGDLAGCAWRALRLWVPDRDAAARLGRYMIRCPIVLERLSLDEGTGEVLYRTRPSRAAHPEGPVARWDVYELIARVLDHLPPPRVPHRVPHPPAHSDACPATRATGAFPTASGRVAVCMKCGRCATLKGELCLVAPVNTSAGALQRSAAACCGQFVLCARRCGPLPIRSRPQGPRRRLPTHSARRC